VSDSWMSISRYFSIRSARGHSAVDEGVNWMAGNVYYVKSGIIYM
jgi:hypothetical protein